MNRKRLLFKTSAIRLLAMTLCVLMLWGMLPGITASAAETPEFEITYEMHARKNPALKQTRAIGTNEYGETTFTTFEDLKSLLSRDYSDTVILAYTGTESLEIKESITIPANVAIYSLAQIVIPSGITVWQNGELLADTLVVDGVLYNYGILDIVSALTINGQVTNCYLIYMYSGIDTVLTGSDNLGYGPQGGYVLWMCGFSSGDELIKSIHATTNPGYHYGHWQYVLYPEVSEINLKHNPDLAPVGDYCTLLIDRPLTINLADGILMSIIGENTMYVNEKLIINGDIFVSGIVYVNAPMEVNGSLATNQGIIAIYYADGGTLTISGTDDYMDRGKPNFPTYFFVSSESTTFPTDALVGFDMNGFTIEEYNDAGHYWALYNYTPHIHSYSVTATVAPTCSEKGYTVYTCACSHSYTSDYVDPTGEHIYTDELDPNCNTCGGIREIEADDSEKTITPMYRLYNPNSGEHFYTGSVVERENLISAGWQYEGVAWNAPTYSGDPVYRLYNPNNGDHHYTMSAEEKDMLVGYGWQYEGVAWNSASHDNLPLYRLYNPNADCGSHHYTGSEEERDNLVAVGWIYEGIGWFGLLN